MSIYYLHLIGFHGCLMYSIQIIVRDVLAVVSLTMDSIGESFTNKMFLIFGFVPVTVAIIFTLPSVLSMVRLSRFPENTLLVILNSTLALSRRWPVRVYESPLSMPFHLELVSHLFHMPLNPPSTLSVWIVLTGSSSSRIITCPSHRSRVFPHLVPCICHPQAPPGVAFPNPVLFERLHSCTAAFVGDIDGGGGGMLWNEIRALRQVTSVGPGGGRLPSKVNFDSDGAGERQGGEDSGGRRCQLDYYRFILTEEEYCHCCQMAVIGLSGIRDLTWLLHWMLLSSTLGEKALLTWFEIAFSSLVTYDTKNYRNPF